MKLTVIIPAHNEEAYLPRCLNALSKQRTQHTFKVILVDNASSDSTAKIAKSWSGKLDVEIVDEPILGRGRARHTGFSKANTEIILSTDADSITPFDWVETLTNTLIKDAEIAAVSGSSYITDGTWLTNWTMKNGMPLSLKLFKLFVGHYMLTGANFAIRKEIYKDAGGFDINRDMLDDVDLSFRVAKHGRIKYTNKAKVLTEGDIFKGSFAKGFLHYFKHFPPLLKKYGFSYRHRKVAKYVH
jgi:glycosyltransferase involved in cell wall biosynthesis